MEANSFCLVLNEKPSSFKRNVQLYCSSYFTEPSYSYEREQNAFHHQHLLWAFIEEKEQIFVLQTPLNEWNISIKSAIKSFMAGSGRHRKLDNTFNTGTLKIHDVPCLIHFNVYEPSHGVIYWKGLSDHQWWGVPYLLECDHLCLHGAHSTLVKTWTHAKRASIRIVLVNYAPYVSFCMPTTVN